MTAISYGGYIFYLVFDPLNDTPECEWVSDTSHYDGVGAIIGQIKDYESCVANIGDIFKKMDLNNDGYLERCEDANFQAAQGQDEAFARKFSTAFTRPFVRIVCDGQFRY